MANVASVLEFIPVGYRFHPTDEELVNHYLTNKLIGENFVVQIIPEIDVCKREPWDIPALSIIKSDDPEWFFFSPRSYKYSNSKRSNRATLRGFWKPTGKDRDIKVRGSNETIGSKKTLVFYTGRVPNGVKTNWVIHEYNAAAFPDDKSNFVLCKLMKKLEKAEGRTDELICDEGGPSSFMASAFGIPASEDRIPDVHSPPSVILDPLFPAQRPADEVDISSLTFPPTVNKQGISISFSPWLNSYTENVGSSVNLPPETTEEEDNADEWKNFLVDDEEEMLLNQTTINTIHKLEVHCESSDTDAEVVSAKYGFIPDTSTKEAKQEKKGRSFQDDLDSSSSDSTPARPLKINRIKHDSSASTLKAWKTQYQPRSADSVSLRAGARRSQTHRQIATKEAYHEAQQKTSKHSNNNKREAQVTDKRNTSKASSSESSGVNGRNSLIQLETPSTSQNLSPRSVYLGNVVIGLFLFMVIIWEILSYGKFC